MRGMHFWNNWYMVNGLALVLRIKSSGLGGCLNIYLPYCWHAYTGDVFLFSGKSVVRRRRLVTWRLSVCD